MDALRLLLDGIASWTAMVLPQPLQPLFVSFSSWMVDNVGWVLLILAFRILISFLEHFFPEMFVIDGYGPSE